MTTEFLPKQFENDLQNEFDKVFRFASSEIKEACAYALFGGGKRIRPTLVFLSAEFLNISYADVLPFAIAIEFIHTYSLIHDDLPCMDNDILRRGKPTVHVKYGEAVALLAGDALLNAAFEVLFSSIQEKPERVNGAKFIASSAGISGMIGGQVNEFIITSPSFDDYIDISLKKTGALLSASVCSPAFLTFDELKRNALSEYGKALGIAFQISDDLLDKEKGENMSFVHIIGEQGARELLQKMFEKANKALSGYPEINQKLLLINQKLINRTY